MNINKYLLDFLKDNVNIDDTRLLTAKSNIAGVTSVIENSELSTQNHRISGILA